MNPLNNTRDPHVGGILLDRAERSTNPARRRSSAEPTSLVYRMRGMADVPTKKLARMLAGGGLAPIETRSNPLPGSLSVYCSRELPGMQAHQQKGSAHYAKHPVSL